MIERSGDVWFEDENFKRDRIYKKGIRIFLYGFKN